MTLDSTWSPFCATPTAAYVTLRCVVKGDGVYTRSVTVDENSAFNIKAELLNTTHARESFDSSNAHARTGTIVQHTDSSSAQCQVKSVKAKLAL